MSKKLPDVNPFRRYDWTGKLFTMDESSIADFSEGDLDEVLFAGQTPDGWDGSVAAICRLKDGRFVAWETTWGPTGDGFAADAYGGEADIFVAKTLETVARLGLTPEGRKLCGYEPELTAAR